VEGRGRGPGVGGDEEGRGEREGVREKGERMTQTLYAHMNKWKKKILFLNKRTCGVVKMTVVYIYSIDGCL
jgi:hypothetical protein